MSDNFPIESYYNNAKILEATLLQTEKDFESAGISLGLNYSGENNMSSLIQKLRPALEKIMNENYQGFLNLLYRIDLNESRLKKELQLQNSRSTEEVIAELIVKRELQKVVIREFYKKENNEN